MKLSQETLAKRSATKKAQREARAKQFIEEHREYLQDAKVMSYGDLMTKYKISYDFCKALEDIYCIQKDEKAVEERRAEKFSKSMQESGLAQRKKTNVARFGVDTPFKLKRVQLVSTRAKEEALRNKARERLEEFVRNSPSFEEDYFNLSVAALARKYGITESYCETVIRHLGLAGKKREMKVQSVDLSLLEKTSPLRVRKILSFLDTNEGFLADVYEMSKTEIVRKYGIPTSFYDILLEELEIVPNYARIRQDRYKRQAESMKTHGNEQMKQTNLARYGVTNPLNREEQVEKKKKAAASEESKQKRQETMLARYGVPCAFGLDKEGYREKAKETLLQRYGVELPQFLARSSSAKSKANKQLAEYLADNGLDVQLEMPLVQVSYDLRVGDRLLIEINPTITHSYTASFGQLTGRFADEPVARTYHFKKWKLARENGFELLSLFDWTSKKKFLDFVLSKCGVGQKTVGARKFKLLEVPKQRFKEVNAFLDENHVLGACRGTRLCYALVDDDAKLYSVMTFGKPRYRTDCDFELLRFASLVGFSIPGAASKLFKRFADEHEGARVITYSDNNLGNGSVYKSLGFEEVGQTGPADVWCSLNGTAYVKDVSLIMQGADRLLGGLVEGYFPVGLDRANFIRRGGLEEYAQEYAEHEDEKDTWWPSNQDIMRHYGFVQVADCGATIWVYDSKPVR